MAVTTKGEIWVIGGEDFSPSDQEEQEESKEEIINTNEEKANDFASMLIFEPLCTGLMKQHDLQAVKVASFAQHQKLILAKTADGRQRLYLNGGKNNSEVKVLETGNTDILDF